jgi:hypothetical protein
VQANGRSICKTICNFVLKCLLIIFYPFIVYYKMANDVFKNEILNDELFSFERR